MVNKENMGDKNSAFQSVTILIAATNETISLRETVNGIRSCCNSNDIEKIIVVVKSTNCPSYTEGCKMVEESVDDKLEVYVQKSPDIIRGGFIEGLQLVKSSHFIIMGSDMEMDPRNVEKFIERAKMHPKRIICASKWHKESLVEGYGIMHELGSRAMNNAVALLYNVKVKDIFSMYQIYPTSVCHKMNFNDESRVFFEYTLKPLRLGVEYEEIPTVYRKRSEGKSNINIWSLLSLAVIFCANALRIRFTPKRYLNEGKKH